MLTLIAKQANTPSAASVGGKTGVDLGNLKNQIGVINSGEMVLVDTSFLDTLPQSHLKSGLAEMLKHGLIHSRAYWNKVSNLSGQSLADLDQLIYESVVIKHEIVEQDPFESGMRKHLNFGHTLGHAIESYCLESKIRPTLVHGEAIAIGIVLATYISSTLVGFDKNNRLFWNFISKLCGVIGIIAADANYL